MCPTRTGTAPRRSVSGSRPSDAGFAGGAVCSIFVLMRVAAAPSRPGHWPLPAPRGAQRPARRGVVTVRGSAWRASVAVFASAPRHRERGLIFPHARDEDRHRQRHRLAREIRRVPPCGDRGAVPEGHGAAPARGADHPCRRGNGVEDISLDARRTSARARGGAHRFSALPGGRSARERRLTLPRPGPGTPSSKHLGRTAEPPGPGSKTPRCAGVTRNNHARHGLKPAMRVPDPVRGPCPLHHCILNAHKGTIT